MHSDLDPTGFYSGEILSAVSRAQSPQGATLNIANPALTAVPFVSRIHRDWLQAQDTLEAIALGVACIDLDAAQPSLSHQYRTFFEQEDFLISVFELKLKMEVELIEALLEKYGR
ncbi:hypothetical protein DXG01_014017 [Tephrocybe rancida]|nr:hypothetical protein DXG01_014017 [Tephrocybe rancida]